MTSDRIVMLGVAAAFVGVLLIILGSVFATVKGRDKANVRSAGVVFIGPIPFGWASDKQTFLLLVVITVVAILVWLFFRLI